MGVDWRREARGSVVTVTAILACFFSGWLIEDLAGLHTDAVILAVVLGMQMSRRARTVSHRHQLTALALVPVLAAGAGAIAVLMRHHVVIGDTAYTLVIAGAIWVRRFGPRAARAGTLATLPLLAMLVAPAAAGSAASHTWWNAIIGLVAVGWVTGLTMAGRRVGLLTPAPGGHDMGGPPARPASRIRPAASTRMAIQMGITVGAAFLIGHQVYGPIHWTWVVLTAYIVPAGNRGRGDVVHKGLLRVLGAAAGTIAATLLAGSFGYRDPWAVVAILATLSVASWLRNFGYAYWAGAVTASLAFMYGYLGETKTSLLQTRLEEIAIGAALAIAVAWLVYPVRTTDVLRRRSADALAELLEYVATARSGDTGSLADREIRVHRRLDDLQQAAVPLVRYRRIVERRPRPRQTADVVRRVVSCREPVHRLTSQLIAEQRQPEEVAGELAKLHQVVTESRRALAATRPTD